MAEMQNEDVVKWVMACYQEAEQAKKKRMARNKDNYAMFHLEHDFSHKEEGQSQEILSKQSMAVEQTKAIFQQALVDIGEWWSAESCYALAEEAMLIKPGEITKLTSYMLERANYFSHVGNSVETALLASLAISKTYGRMVPKPRFVSRKKGRGKGMKRWVERIDDKTWQLKFDVIRPENYYPDPTGKGLYEIEDMWLDLHEVITLSEGDEAIYDAAIVKDLSVSVSVEAEDVATKARETGQDPTVSGHRPQVKLTEYWGTILDSKTGKIMYENCVCTVANDTYLIRKPEPNPLWHQQSPYTASPLMEVANSVWHKAPMDAPTQHNRAQIEIYNLIMDAGFDQVHAIKQLRKEWLDNPAQVAEGVRPGMTLTVNSLCPPGGKVLEPVTTTIIPAEAFNVFNIMAQEFNAAALTSDIRNGMTPSRDVKATAIVEQSQTITSVFSGMAKNYEARQSTKELALGWMTTAQNWDRISKEEFVSLFGQERGTELSQLSPEDVFTATVSGIKFRVFGISLTLSKSQDFRKYSTLLQTIAASPPLLEEFMKKYSLGMFLGEIMTSLDIDKHKLEIPQAVQATMQAPSDAGPEAQPDDMSQVPQAGAGSLADMFGGSQGEGLPQMQFPGSPATAGGM